MVRRIAIVAYPDVQLLDVAGPLEVFATADRFARESGTGPAYAAEVVARRGGPLQSSSGLTFTPARRLAEVAPGLDTLVVAGGTGTPAAARDAELLAWLRQQAPRTRRVASVCSGAFVLAAAGLLDGRRVPRRIGACADAGEPLPRRAGRPAADLRLRRNVRSSAGVTAGMDLALALVEEDHGARLALAIARHLVVFVRRPGGQAQFSAQLALQSAQRAPLRDLQAWLADHLDAELSVAALADRAA